MVDGASRDPRPQGKRGFPEIDPSLRATAAATAGGTLVILWPAFTLGAYGAVFFDAVLGIWAVATAVLLSGLMLRTRGALPWGGWVALALPSVWVVLAVVAPRAHGFRYLHYFEVVLTLVGAPTLTWLLSRILLPDYAELPELHRLRAIAVTIAVGVLAFLLGKFNYLFLTCADFDISGNNPPSGCTHGPPFHLL
ncbi:hypothetical protein [Streptosporangium lutulentum]|uniref:Uncharacterized protein n=1 Tax=Streptosporangium lutulentum TaxID=1461250 RepID=A0ABT9Q978_9ACTN|nr:hypothetical protein [Streptosporangium lutulentum]MDP9842629.1 hypothetical protein [Streptosporangium lutulentum]